MENQRLKFNGVLDCETFGDRNRQYFLDIKQTANKRPYLAITRRDQTEDNPCTRSQVTLFEDDLQFFVEAVTMLLGRYATGNLGISC